MRKEEEVREHSGESCMTEPSESGPFCRHWSDPGECDAVCKCGHKCCEHDALSGCCNECDCEGFEDEAGQSD